MSGFPAGIVVLAAILHLALLPSPASAAGRSTHESAPASMEATPAAPLPAVLCDASGIQELRLFSNDLYRIAVGVLPPNPQFGELRLIVRVCDAATGEPVRHARVTLVPTSPEGRRGAPVLALSRFGGPEEYDADMTVRAPGSWRYEITVGAAKGSAVLEVTLPVRERAWYGDGSTIVFSIVGLVLLGGCVHLYRSSQAAQRRRRDRAAQHGVSP